MTYWPERGVVMVIDSNAISQNPEDTHPEKNKNKLHQPKKED